MKNLLFIILMLLAKTTFSQNNCDVKIQPSEYAKKNMELEGLPMLRFCHKNEIYTCYKKGNNFFVKYNNQNYKLKNTVLNSDDISIEPTYNDSTNEMIFYYRKIESRKIIATTSNYEKKQIIPLIEIVK